MQSEEQRNQETMLALIKYQPFAATLLHQRSCLEQMAQELTHALRHTSRQDLAKLFSQVSPLKLDHVFDDRYFMASNELNLLNTLLLANEVEESEN